MYVRFGDDEHEDVVVAARLAGLTPAGYVAQAAVAAACGSTAGLGEPVVEGVSRAELAQVQRELFAARTAVNRLSAGLGEVVAAGGPAAEADVLIGLCVRSVQRLDEAAVELDRLLRRTGRQG